MAGAPRVQVLLRLAPATPGVRSIAQSRWVTNHGLGNRPTRLAAFGTDDIQYGLGRFLEVRVLGPLCTGGKHSHAFKVSSDAAHGKNFCSIAPIGCSTRLIETPAKREGRAHLGMSLCLRRAFELRAAILAHQR